MSTWKDFLGIHPMILLEYTENITPYMIKFPRCHLIVWTYPVAGNLPTFDTFMGIEIMHIKLWTSECHLYYLYTDGDYYL